MTISDTTPKITKKTPVIKERPKVAAPVAPPSITEETFKKRHKDRHMRIFGKPQK